MMEWIDFHAHILPHMDHGSTHTDMALHQLALMQETGVHTVCATSHFYPQDILPATFLENRRKSMGWLLKAAVGVPRPAIIPAAEVLICRGMEEMDGLADLCMEGTNVLLLEMPFVHDMWDTELIHTVSRIVKKGLVPILAHVDRYPRHAVEVLFDMGLYGQINTGSLVKLFRSGYLLRWMEEGRIVALGSDLHGHSPRSYASFSRVCKRYPQHTERIMRITADLLQDAKRY